MEQATIFGDIHGNITALEAVFADMERRGAGDNLYCLGDLVGYGVFPNDVIDRIRARDIPTIMGNYDQGVGNSSDDCGCAYTTETARQLGNQSIAWTNKAVTDENKAFLRSLRQQISIRVGDHSILLVHGSPRKINEYMYEDRPDSYFERIMQGIDDDILICGHTHLPYHKILPDGQQIINAGSVGKPKDDNPQACYVILSTASDGLLDVEFVRVPYEVEQAAVAIEASDMPSEYAQMLRVGRG